MEKDAVLVSDADTGLEEIVSALRESIPTGELRVLSNLEQALELISSEKNELVFCYLRSGAIASSLFLNEVWKSHPRGARFLLDPAPTSDALVRCIVGAHTFLQLPLNRERLRDVVQRPATRLLVPNERIQNVVSRMRTLPTEPTAYLSLIREIRSPHATTATVGDLVARDLVVSAKLVQLANSGYFGRRHRVADVGAAVVYLGLDTTASVVLSIAAFARFDKLKPISPFSAEKVWMHSQMVDDLARSLSRLVTNNEEIESHAFLAALLHDIGKLVLLENFHDDYCNVTKAAEDQNRSIFEMEREILRATHAEIGAYLLALWGLPHQVVDAVARHHDTPGSLGADFSPAVAVNLAEQLIGSFDPVEDIIVKYPPELPLREHLSTIVGLLPPGARKPKKRDFNWDRPALPKPAPSVETFQPSDNQDHAMMPAHAPQEVNRTLPFQKPSRSSGAGIFSRIGSIAARKIGN